MNDTLSSPSTEEITSPAGEQANMQIAFAALLATRSPTFLARLPRILKISVVCLVFLVALYSCKHKDVAQESGHVQDAAILASSHTSDNAVSEDSTRVAAKPQTASEKVELKTDAEKVAGAFNDSVEPTARMAAAPDLGLVEETPAGRLPKVSVDGRRPWQVYARPFNFLDPRPRISIVITDLGLSRVATDATLRRMPQSVTLAFDGQAQALESWLTRARQDGHETLLSIPMEPFDYPRSDPGPNSLLTAIPNADNIQRLLGFLKQGTGYVGIAAITGSRFSADSTKLFPVLNVLRDRGLLILDGHSTSHSAISALASELRVPATIASRVIDSSPTPQTIDDALSDLEQTARFEGSAVGIASPLPLTLERIEAWAKTLADRGMVLAPISAVVK